MKKPMYDYESLKQNVTKCKDNIKAFSDAIIEEQKKIGEMAFYIKQHELYKKSLKGKM